MTCLDAYSQVQESTTLSSLEDSEACTLAKDGFAESGCLCAPEGAKVDPLLRGGSNAHHVRLIIIFARSSCHDSTVCLLTLLNSFVSSILNSGWCC